MIAFLTAGGPVMIPIGLCSLIAMATFLERWWALREHSVVPADARREVLEVLRQGRPGDGLALCKREQMPMARVLEVAIEHRDRPRVELREKLEEVGRREAANLERYLPILGTIASIAPLLGLLGTVGGMILTFDVIEHQGLGDVGALAGGISQALITTFAGLCVGIPALVANRYLLARVDRLVMSLEEVTTEAIELLMSDSEEAR